MKDEDKSFYHQNGWLHLENVIPQDLIDIARTSGKKLVTKIYEENLFGQPCPHGPLAYWQGVGCAGAFDSKLFDLYTSKINYDITHELMGESVYLYNDEMVYKMPFHNEWFFHQHTDNQHTPNKKNKLHYLNVGWVLDDFTEDNGPLEIFYQNEWKKMLPKTGDVICLRGNTWHRSAANKSGKPRGFYACNFVEDKMIFQNFYTEKFEKPSSV